MAINTFVRAITNPLPPNFFSNCTELFAVNYINALPVLDWDLVTGEVFHLDALAGPPAKCHACLVSLGKSKGLTDPDAIDYANLALQLNAAPNPWPHKPDTEAIHVATSGLTALLSQPPATPHSKISTLWSKNLQLWIENAPTKPQAAPETKPKPTRTKRQPQFDPWAFLGRETTPRTQKARGVLQLRNHTYPVPTFTHIQTARDITKAWTTLSYLYSEQSKHGLFARPCPVRPRHGFVDSQKVQSIDELRTVWRRARKADPEAEVLLMLPIDAQFNAIWRPDALVFGPGHDGATSGINSHTLPLIPRTNPRTRQLATEAGVVEPEVPYIEAVLHQSEQAWRPPTLYFTQIRGGPKVDGLGPDFIPQRVTINEVVLAEGDLMQWEERTTLFSPGTVVYHPGGSLASHYAVHCVLHHIPILISREPKVGETLVPTTQKEPLSVTAATYGLGAGTAVKLHHNMYANAVNTLLIALHNVSAFQGRDSYYLGAAAALMHRLGLAALLGESRHGGMLKEDRDNIYTHAISRPFDYRHRARDARELFLNHAWRKGYGGKPWALCTESLIRLDNTIRNFAKSPSELTLQQLATSLNEAVHQAHNGGWWLSKFVQVDQLDMAATGAPEPALNAVPVLAALNLVTAAEAGAKLGSWRRTQPIMDNELLLLEPDLIPITNIHGTTDAKYGTPRLKLEVQYQGYEDNAYDRKSFYLDQETLCGTIESHFPGGEHSYSTKGYTDLSPWPTLFTPLTATYQGRNVIVSTQCGCIVAQWLA